MFPIVCHKTAHVTIVNERTYQCTVLILQNYIQLRHFMVRVVDTLYHKAGYLFLKVLRAIILYILK